MADPVEKSDTQRHADEKKGEYLMAEYHSVTAQLIHYDSLFWTKAQFYMAFEGIVLLATLNKYLSYSSGTKPMTITVFFLLLLLVTLNVGLCWVWMRTGLRNRVFLKSRFRRAEQIEKQKPINNIIKQFHYQNKYLKENQLGQGSHQWEACIPLFFILIWVGLLFFGTTLLESGDGLQAFLWTFTVMALSYVFIKLYGIWAEDHLGDGV
jgi:hypothetical protein